HRACPGPQGRASRVLFLRYPQGRANLAQRVPVPIDVLRYAELCTRLRPDLRQAVPAPRDISLPRGASVPPPVGATHASPLRRSREIRRATHASPYGDRVHVETGRGMPRPYEDLLKFVGRRT